MGYTQDFSHIDANAKSVGKMLAEGWDGVNGDSQIEVTGIANDTGFTSGDIVSLWPGTSGYLVDDAVNDSKQYLGVVQDTPGSSGVSVKVCIGGLSYLNLSSAQTSTSWGACVAFINNVPSFTDAAGAVISTVPTTGTIGWVVSSGSLTTAGEGLVFLDQPWKEVDTTT